MLKCWWSQCWVVREIGARCEALGCHDIPALRKLECGFSSGLLDSERCSVELFTRTIGFERRADLPGYPTPVFLLVVVRRDPSAHLTVLLRPLQLTAVTMLGRPLDAAAFIEAGHSIRVTPGGRAGQVREVRGTGVRGI